MAKLILDLCAGSGAWSEPYKRAGYDVRAITLPEDVRLVTYPGRVHGILAAPPCTIFSRAGARWQRTEAQLLEALSVVDACLRLVTVARPQWWALENPIGSLQRYLGPPCLKIDPCLFGDGWTKRTWLWGRFAPPMFTCVVARPEVDVTTHKRHGMAARSVTPPGFARAFYEANP